MLTAADDELKEAMTENPSEQTKALLNFVDNCVAIHETAANGDIAVEDAERATNDIPQFYCAATAFIMSCLFQAPSVRKARNRGADDTSSKGESNAPNAVIFDAGLIGCFLFFYIFLSDSCLFAHTVDLICDPAQKGGSWTRTKARCHPFRTLCFELQSKSHGLYCSQGNTLLLCAHLSSFTRGTSKEATDRSRFDRVSGICAHHMEGITAVLSGLEQEMRSNGEFDKLAALQAPTSSGHAG